jgi:type II secretory pathway pseudopilin PulG
MSLSKRRQAGSAVTFVIIAIILVAATIGSVAFVVQRGNQARKDDAASKIAAQEADQKAAQKAKDAQAATDAAAASKNPTPTDGGGTSTAPAPTPSTALPTTGAELDITRLVAMGLLTATATSFIVSRRGLKRPL